MKALLTSALCLLFCLCLSASAVAEVPPYLNYQGRLTNTAGEPMDTTVDVTFALYTAQTGGTQFWLETHPDVVVTDGLFQVMLGSVVSLDHSDLDGNMRWLAIAVGDDEFSPDRVPLISSAYSFRAVHADTADYVPGVQLSGWELSGNYVRLDDINDMVGIGVASPAQKLHLHGNLLLDDNFDILWGNSLARLDNSSADLSIEAADDIFLEPTDKVYIKDIAGSSWMVVDPAGKKVGLGITSPTEMLHVKNDASGGRAYLQVETSHASNWHEAGIRFKTPQNTWYFRMDDDANNDMPSGGLGLRNDIGGNVMTWTADGKLGIGLESPDERLHIENSASGGRAFLQIETSHATNWHEVGIRFKTPQNTWHLRMDDDLNNNIPDGALGLRSQIGVESMTWLENGKVGVGTTAPQQRLHVAGNAKIRDTLFIGAMPEDVLSVENIDDDAGVASVIQSASDWVTLTTSYASMMSRQITVPGPGHVYAIGSCQILVDHGVSGWDETIAGISTSSTSVSVSRERSLYLGSNFDAGVIGVPLSCQAIYEVGSAGTYTYYFNAKKAGTGSGSHVLWFGEMTLLYVPSNYGSVSTKLAEATAPRSLASEFDQTTIIGQNNSLLRSLQQELSALRDEVERLKNQQ